MVEEACKANSNKFISRAAIKGFLSKNHGFVDNAVCKNNLKKALVKFEKKGDKFRMSKEMMASKNKGANLAAKRAKAAAKKAAAKAKMAAKREAAKAKKAARAAALKAKKQAKKDKIAAKDVHCSQHSSLAN